MKDNCRRKFWCGRTAENIARGMLVAFAALAISGIASAQDKQVKKDEFAFDLLSNVPTPTAITPPAGNHLFLAGHAFGSQGYVCLPKDGSVSWTVNGARPEATLFASVFGEPVQIITHFLSHDDNPFGQKTRRGQSPTEQSRFLFLINVSASVAFNELVVEPLYDLGPIEELCNQGENPKQNHHSHASRA